MSVRSMWLGVSFLLFALTLSAEDKVATPKVGDSLGVKMTGELAKEYATRSGLYKPGSIRNANGFRFETLATVAQRLPDGSYRIEHSMIYENGGSKPRMMTLRVIVQPTQIKSMVTPAKTALYSSPGDVKKGIKPFVTTKDHTGFYIELSNLREAKLRTWEMVEEVGE